MKRIIVILSIVLLLLPDISFATDTAYEKDPTGFNTAREIADFMETHYGVTIAIGPECKDIHEENISIGNKPKGRTPFLDIVGFYNYTSEIQMIDDAFSIYPPDFFEHFKCMEAPKGIRFLLADRLLVDEKTIAGATSVQDEYYNIFLGVGTFNELNIHHEIWHAMEFRILVDNPETFENWNDLNPDGFEYMDQYFAMDNWTQAQPKDEWFIREYSTINEMEDRATVIEAIFQQDDAWWDNHPHIAMKLNALLDAAEPIFGPVYFHE